MPEIEKSKTPLSESSLPPLEPQIIPVKKLLPKKYLLITLGLIFLVGISLAFWQIGSLKLKTILEKTKESPANVVVPPAPLIEKGRFAQYKEVPVSFSPQVPAYEINSELSNVQNIDQFKHLIDKGGDKLTKNGFFVEKGWSDEFFSVYESNRYAYIPNFITSDSLVHSYHLLFNSLLEKLEKNRLNQKLIDFNNEMILTQQAYLEEFKGTSWENAAKRNLAFVSVASKLIDPNFNIPDSVKEPVEKELKLIADHQGIVISPVIALGVFNDNGDVINPSLFPSKTQLDALKEDYTQYIPRGHYDKSELLKNYFKAMMWYGRLTFRFKNDDEIRSAVLLTRALKENQKAYSNWEAINETINFFVGKSDDVDYYLFSKPMDEVYGNSADKGKLLLEDKFLEVKSQLASLEPPAINSIPIYRADLQPDREEEIKGFRLMGQKFTMDASIFQRLVCREVGTNAGQKLCGGGIPGSRMLPKGLDITAAMGSSEAYDILDSQGETKYLNYPENMTALKSYLLSLSQPVWTQNLYWTWLYSLKPLTEVKAKGYPFFMQNPAWLRKQLNTYLGSWTELKHDTILYAKQVYAELGGGPPEEKDDRGYVEPEPYVYARLAALTKMTYEGLSSRALTDEADTEILKIMEELCLSLKSIAEKELNNQSLTDKEYELIRAYGGSLEHLFMKAMEDNCKDKSASQCLDDNPAALVADVATDPNGQVLEEAIGKINNIYVLVMVEGKLKIAKGGVFSYYEFPWPMNDRLTDSKWREILSGEKIPPLPEWTQSFLAD